MCALVDEVSGLYTPSSDLGANDVSESFTSSDENSLLFTLSELDASDLERESVRGTSDRKPPSVLGIASDLVLLPEILADAGWMEASGRGTACTGCESNRVEPSGLEIGRVALGITLLIPSDIGDACAAAEVVTGIADADASGLFTLESTFEVDDGGKDLSTLYTEGKDGKVASYYMAVPKALSTKLSAKDWLAAVAPVLSGTGGGSPTFAQGSGKGVDKVDEAVRVGKEFAQSKL